jgi:hypothetical protein
VLNDKPNAKGEYTIFHSRRGGEETVHISRMVLYNPWSDQHLDTADGSMVAGYDIRRKDDVKQSDSAEPGDSEFRSGDDVHLKEFVIIAINPDNVHRVPFMVCKLYELGPLEEAVETDGVRYRSVKGRIYGNTNSDPTKIYRPGWIDKDNRPYFKAKPLHPSHQPYTTEVSHGDVSTYSVILAGFNLDYTTEKLPSNVLTALRQCPWIDWKEE